MPQKLLLVGFLEASVGGMCSCHVHWVALKGEKEAWSPFAPAPPSVSQSTVFAQRWSSGLMSWKPRTNY